MTTENKLTTINLFPDEETYDSNKGSLGNSDLALVPLVIPEQVNADWNASSGPSQILNKPNLNFVPLSGSRGNLSGYETPVVQSTALTITNNSRDTNLVTGAVRITVNNGASNQAWTKTVALTNSSASISLGSSWKWYGGSAPDISSNCVLVLHWCSTFGVANLVVSS